VRGPTVHREVDGHCSYFSAVDFVDRLTAHGSTLPPVMETMTTRGRTDPLTAINAWLGTAYHTLPFINCTANVIGFGGAKNTDWRGFIFQSATTMDFSYGNPGAACPGDGPASWPRGGAIDVPTSGSGNENPRPPIAYPSGPVFLFRQPKAQISDAWLIDKSTGLWVETAHYYRGSDPNGLLEVDHEALMIPRAPPQAEHHLRGSLQGHAQRRRLRVLFQRHHRE
jgi:hypothetical protein